MTPDSPEYSSGPLIRLVTVDHVRWTAIVLAGERPGGDPLAAHFKVSSKALIPVAGETMLRRVVNTLLAAPPIERIIVLAQDTECLFSAPDLRWMSDEPRIVAMQSGSTISGSILNTLDRSDVAFPVLITTADNCLLTPQILGSFLDAAEGVELAVGAVARNTLERDYGGCQRSWLRFSDGDYTGANLFALRSQAVANALVFWERVEADRKKLWKIAARFGPRLLLNVLLRRLSFADAVTRGGGRLGVAARPVILAHGRAGIDVDKLSDHALAEAILAA